MSEQVIHLVEVFQELYDLGLWPRNLSPPEPTVLERLYTLEKDMHRRLYELSVPEGREDIVLEVMEEYAREKLERSPREKAKSNWVTEKRKFIFHLGRGVSSQLLHIEEDTKKLKKLGLPSLKTIRALTKFTNLNKQGLMKLCYHRRVRSYTNYVDFTVMKKSGGIRHLSAPKPYLKRIQYNIKEKILDLLEVPDHITGFVPTRSTKTNANRHVGSTLIINADIEDFFPSIHFYRVRKFFRSLGYSGQSSTILSLLTTKQAISPIELEGRKYYALSKHRFLPQGAPTSPVLSNHIAIPMDNHMIRRLEPLGFKYSRYADDITISTDNTPSPIRAALSILYQTSQMHGFRLNQKKIRVIGKNDRQEITGLVINSGRITIPRNWRRNLRARIHRFITQGEGDLDEILGSISYLQQFHPKIASGYLAQLELSK